jgi:Mg-chelatase subunit ChlI
VTDRDIAMAAELALPHRLKRGPFMQSEMTMEDLQERIETLQGAASKGQSKPDDEAEEETADAQKKK